MSDETVLTELTGIRNDDNSRVVEEISLKMGLVLQLEELKAEINNSLKLLFPNSNHGRLVHLDEFPNDSFLKFTYGSVLQMLFHVYHKSKHCNNEKISKELRQSLKYKTILQQNIPAYQVVSASELKNISEICQILHLEDLKNEAKGIVILLNRTCEAESSKYFIFMSYKFHSNTEAITARCNFLNKQVSITLTRVLKTENSKEFRHKSVLQLCESLYDADEKDIQKKVMAYLIPRINCESGFILLVDKKMFELIVDVVNQKILEQPLNYDANTQGAFKTVIETKKSCYKKIIYANDCPMTTEIMKHSNSPIKIKNLIYVPITSKETNEIVAVVCLINHKSNFKLEPFNNEHEEIIQECFKYIGSILFTTIAYHREQILTKQSKKILDVACNIFSQMGDLNKLLWLIMEEARNLIKAEKCSVFLIDNETNELVAKIFDGIVTTGDKEEQDEIRMPINQGIAGYVATHGEMLNIRDAYSYPLFNRAIDEKTGFKTNCILTFPLKDDQDNIVGVAQLCNKTRGLYFTKVDEECARAFAIYCCISITHSLLYKKVQDAQKRNQLANELMMYHMQVPETELDLYSHIPIEPVTHYLSNFNSFRSIPRNIPDCDTVMACLSMFDKLQFISRWKIHRKTLTRFICMVKRSYREPPYHNWMHAFSVAHFVYLCLTNLQKTLKTQLRDIEIFALFVASLCHDVDHRGTNNKYQVESGSVLAALYSSEGSVLERHHFSQTVCILNTKGCNLFENLSSDQYCEILDLMRVIILATDINHHSQIRGQIERLADGKSPTTGLPEHISINNQEHRELLLCLLMTSADLSDQTKPWSNTRAVAKIIYQEFFTQGDLERVNLGLDPAEMYDRKKADIPHQQLGFLKIFVLPLYKVLSKIYIETESVVKVIETNGKNWEIICQKILDKEIEDTEDVIFEGKIEGLIENA